MAERSRYNNWHRWGIEMEKQQAKQLIEQEPWHVWVMWYGITHGRRMELALHHGVPQQTRITCEWVSHFCGDFEGGPYRLTVSEKATADGSQFRIASEDGRLVIVCSGITVGGLTPEINPR